MELALLACLAVLAFIALMVLLSAIKIVPEYERGVIFRLGRWSAPVALACFW